MHARWQPGPPAPRPGSAQRSARCAQPTAPSAQPAALSPKLPAHRGAAQHAAAPETSMQPPAGRLNETLCWGDLLEVAWTAHQHHVPIHTNIHTTALALHAPPRIRSPGTCNTQGQFPTQRGRLESHRPREVRGPGLS
eukprot:354272-Chlamydomonas_euryale.AAC.3